MADNAAIVLSVFVIVIIIAIGMCLQYLPLTAKYIPTMWSKPSMMRVLQEMWTSISGKSTIPVIFVLQDMFKNQPLETLNYMPLKQILSVMNVYWDTNYRKNAELGPTAEVEDSVNRFLADRYYDQTTKRACGMIGSYWQR